MSFSLLCKAIRKSLNVYRRVGEVITYWNYSGNDANFLTYCLSSLFMTQPHRCQFFMSAIALSQ